MSYNIKVEYNKHILEYIFFFSKKSMVLATISYDFKFTKVNFFYKISIQLFKIQNYIV